MCFIEWCAHYRSNCIQQRSVHRYILFLNYLIGQIYIWMVGQYLQHTYVALDGCNNHGCGFLVVFGVHFSSTINQHACNLVFITVRDKFGGGDKLVVAS